MSFLDFARNKSILLIEDDEDLRVSMSEYLRAVGFTVIMAVDGVEANQKILNQKFDLIISDLVMPKRDGIEAIQRIRAGNSVNKDTPIIVTSGNLNSFAIDELKGQITKAFTKPFGMGDLVSYIQSSIQFLDKKSA